MAPAHDDMPPPPSPFSATAPHDQQFGGGETDVQIHSFSKFFTGNKNTLLEGTKRQGINLRQQLMKFYEVYYSANQMSLAVVAPQSLSQLSKYVKEAFGTIPNRNVDPPEDRWAYRVPPYGKPGLIPSDKSVVEIVPIQELRQVTVTWPIIFKSKKERDAFRLNKVGRWFIIFRTSFLKSFYVSQRDRDVIDTP